MVGRSSWIILTIGSPWRNIWGMINSVPGEERGVGGAPGVDVEHRHDQQAAVALAEADRVRRRRGHRVQPRRAVRVDDALGVARRARGVTHDRGGALVELGPLEAGLLGREEGLVVDRLAEHAASSSGPWTMMCLTVGIWSRTFAKRRDQRSVDDDDRVLGVVDDEGQLFGEEPDVERVQDGAHARDGEVGLHVRLVVPHERRHAVTGLHAEFAQRRGQLLGALGDLEERRLLDPVGRDGEDLLVGVHELAVADDAADEQWRVLHRALHGSPS